MRFYLHGSVTDSLTAALERHGHRIHRAPELAEENASPAIDQSEPRQLLPALVAKQWHLLTTDADFIHRLYETKTEFPAGIVIHLLDAAAAGDAIDRLFARYPRLTPKRLYTVTASRVKIRQLPGPPG